MRRLPAVIAAFACVCLVATSAAHAQTPARAAEAPQSCPALSAAIQPIGEAALASGAPGLVMGIGQPGRPDIVRAWGAADVEQGAPLTPASVFRIASLTKQFTAALVMRLVQDGRLHLDDRVITHLPELTWLGDITVDQLLVQTSGLPDYAQDPAGDAAKASVRSSQEMLDWIGRLAAQSEFAPGQRWAYSNSNYVVLGALVERITGQSFEDALMERILRPAGLHATAVDDPRDVVPGRVHGYSRQAGQLRNAAWIHPSMPGPAGSLRSTAADLLRWNEALYSSALLDDATRARMTAPGRLYDGRTTRLGMPQAWQDGLQADYAMGLFVSTSELGPRLWHSGDIDGFVTWMAHYPEAGVSIVLLQNGDFLDVDHRAVEQAVAADLRCQGR